MLLSIVIPVYNAEDYLERCLDSIISQSYTNIEILVVDDASTDNSLQILKTYEKKDTRIKLFANKKNSLAGKARNIGSKNASGDFIWFVDADDWLEEDAVCSVVHFLNNKHSDILVVGFTECFSKNKKKQYLPDDTINTELALFYFLQIRKGFYSMPFPYIFNKRFLETYGINFQEEVYYEDIVFVAKALFFSNGNIKILRKNVYNYYKENDSSITKRSSAIKISHLLASYEALKDFLKEKKILQSYKKPFLHRFIVFGLSKCFKMYFGLSMKKRNTEAVKNELEFYRKSSLLDSKNLSSIAQETKKMDGFSDKKIRKEYKKNLGFLWWVRKSPLVTEVGFRIVSILNFLRKRCTTILNLDLR